MHYLVTGGCGFIGLHLARALLAGGHRVTIMDDLSNSQESRAPAQARLIVHDITLRGAMDSVLKEVDGVFHLAAVVSVMESAVHWRRTHEVNLGGTVALFDALVRAGRKLPVVYASSAAVYGDSDAIPFAEDTPCAPISAYGADKLACELHARVGWLVHGIPSLGLRFFNVYGPGQDAASPYAGVISIFSRQMQQSETVTIYGDGEQTRDYIYVADVVSALLLAMDKLENGALSGSVLNVCTGTPVSVNHLAQLIAGLTGSPSGITRAAARPGDIRMSLGDPSCARDLLGFEAQTKLRDGLEAMLGIKNSEAA